MKIKNKIQNSLGLIFMAVGFILIFTFVFALIGNSNGGGSSESQSTEKINYISFTVDETEYTSPKNWTWGQYVNSVYCDDLTVDSDYVLSQTGIVAIGNEKVLLSDKIIADTNYSSIQLLTFSIGETSYNFESGMTWNDWKNSSFNKDNYYLIDNYIYLSETGVVTYNNSNVLKTDTIIANASYGYTETIYFELKVDSNDYNRCIAISGMTWQQWVASDYNYLDITISNDYVKVGNYFIHKFGTNDFVLGSDTIISGHSYTYRNEQISFTIDNVSFTADNNMTWQQWVNSPYNTSNCAFNGSNVTYNNYSGYIAYNGSYVLKTDSIIANANYTVDSTISFNIGNTTYNSYGAIIRPAWQSWVNSEYNTDNYIIVGDYIYSSQYGVVTYNGNNVLKTDKIVADGNYLLVETSSFIDYMGNYYRFINGMTWSQWLNSGFNTSTYNSGNNTIFATSGQNLVIYDDTGTVTVNDIIIANYEYNWQSPVAYDTATDIITVGNSVYYVKRNATWSQWLENGDGFPTNDFTIDSNNYIYTENGYVTYNGNFVVKADTVVRGATYTLTYNTYTITYMDNGNTAFSGTHESGYPITHTYGTSTTLKSATKSDYTFRGWFTDSACTTATNGSLGATAYTSNITLYAKWTPKTYSITYKDGGNTAFSGTLDPLTPFTHTYGTDTVLKNPTKTGYTFCGWYLDSACSAFLVTRIGATSCHSDIILYAKWTASTYAITYKDGGNTTFSGTHESDYPTTHTYGTATTLKTATKTGYTFDGWYLDSACTTATNGTLGATAYTSNITLYAKWTVNIYTITYNLNGGSVANSNPSSYTIETSSFILNNPTKTGYTFSGWTGTDLLNATTSVTVASGSTGNRSYTATWLANTYAITYKDGGNTTFSGTHASGYPTTHTYGTATTLKTATKTGYTFDGWFTDSACTTATNGSLGATSYTSNIILYAKWTINTITFTIDNTSYTATSGMTWTQWVASAYNTANFTIDSNNNVSCSTGLVTYNNTSVVNTDTITANANYTITSSSPQVQSPYFTYGGTNYYFESGMTWGDWISSAYNTRGFSNGGSGNGYKVIVFKTFYLVYDEVDRTPVIVSDLITDGHTYFLGG